MAKKKTNQMRILEIIIKKNPKVTIGEAGKAYRYLKELGAVV